MDAVAFLRMADEKRRGRIVSKTAASHARRMRIGIAIAAEMWAAVVCANVRAEIALTLPALRLIVRKVNAPPECPLIDARGHTTARIRPVWSECITAAARIDGHAILPCRLNDK